MDAHAILTAQGWRGTGHTLHPTSDTNGLTHHLLIKREGTDGRGLGSRKDHKAEAWWMNAFDQALKGIDVSNKSGLKQTTNGGALALDKITARGAGKYTGSRGLYQSFVKGGTLTGTVSEWKQKQASEAGLMTPPESGVETPLETKTKETKEERRARRESKRLEKAAKAAKQDTDAKAALKLAKKKAKEAVKATESREERRLRRDARRARKDEKRRKKSSNNG